MIHIFKYLISGYLIFAYLHGNAQEIENADGKCFVNNSVIGGIFS